MAKLSPKQVGENLAEVIALKVFEREEEKCKQTIDSEDLVPNDGETTIEGDNVCNINKEDGSSSEPNQDSLPKMTTCSENSPSKECESLSPVLKRVAKQSSNSDQSVQRKHGGTLSAQPESERTKKKSRVDFHITQRTSRQLQNLESLIHTTTVKHDSLQYKRKPRRSFSGGQLSSTMATRVQRFSVGANRQPKGLTPQDSSLLLPVVPENGTSGSMMQSIPENKVLVELDELDLSLRIWRQTTRWIKYEEHVQSNGNWSRPRVPFVEVEGFFALKDYLHEGLVFLEFSSDGLLDFSHTLATTITMCNRFERRYRLKLQQVIYLPVLHQGDTPKRLHVKKCYREIIEKNEADRRTELIKKAFETSEDRVRNQWVHLSRKALMFSKLSAGWDDSDDHDMDCDEAMINIFGGQNQRNRTQDTLVDLQSSQLCKLPEDVCNVSISEYSDINPDRYPLTANQERLLKALSRSCEGVAIKYAPLDFLGEFESFVVLIRLTYGTQLCDFLEVPIDCKYVFLLCSSLKRDRHKDLEVCRAFGSLMTDKVFRYDLLSATRKRDVIAAVDKYVNDSVLFPPGQWDLQYLKPATEEITHLSSQRHVVRNQNIKTPPRKRKINCVVNEPVITVPENEYSRRISALPIRRDTMVSSDDAMSFLKDFRDNDSSGTSIVYSPLLGRHPLDPDGRWFGGVRREMAQRYPLYCSDIKDAFHIQCLAAIFFVTFGVVALAVTFGNLLVKYTDGYMGNCEMFIATSFSCILMALMGTEPHTVIGGTAAMVVIETVIYKAASLFDVHYLTWRLWIGLWIAIILLLILAYEKTYWIKFCTRFTEEILHSMIAILFILEAFKDIYKVFKRHPLRDSYIVRSLIDENSTNSSSSHTEAYGRPNTALLHTLTLFSTFGIAVGLRLFQDTRYFSPLVRRLLNFFAIPLAVIIMYLVTKLLNVYLNTVDIKHGINLTSPDKRSWFINPNLSGRGRLGWGMAVLAIFPAFFVVIVIFIETEITALMCYKETIPRKGSGFHVNLLVVAISVVICSIFGLPWMCLAAVETSNHIDSLRVWTSFNIPGIKSRVERIRQQRVSLFFIGLSAGLFLFQPFAHKQIPIAMLSGLTLYMGVVATFGVQFFKRLELMFMAPSQHPYIEYLVNVPLAKVYLFTVIQIVMIALLMAIKSVESISFIFPIFIVLMIPTRLLLGKYVFTTEEMEQLDNEEEDEHH